jgi:hypothetical protein
MREAAFAFGPVILLALLFTAIKFADGSFGRNVRDNLIFEPLPGFGEDTSRRQIGGRHGHLQENDLPLNDAIAGKLQGPAISCGARFGSDRVASRRFAYECFGCEETKWLRIAAELS